MEPIKKSLLKLYSSKGFWKLLIGSSGDFITSLGKVVTFEQVRFDHAKDGAQNDFYFASVFLLRFKSHISISNVNEWNVENCHNF